MKRKQKKQPARRAVLETIEPRILYSADFSPGLLDPGASLPETEQRVLGTGGEFDQQTTQQGQTRRHELVLVESNTPDYQKLIDDIVKQGGEGRDIEVVVLDASRDGIEQITDIMAARQDLDAVHLISYGANGQVQLGSTSLNFDTLLKSAAQIKGWGNSLSADADILLYGCDIAQDAEGRALVDALGRLTGADVAASVDLTGNALRGGDWDLEYNAGPMETAIAVSPDAQQTWQGLLDITTGLKGHWKLDANANDFSGNNYNGTLTNGALIDTTGGTNKVGAGKLSVDGVNDYVDLSAYVANFASMTQGTISAWIKTTDAEGSIFSFVDTADADSAAWFWVHQGKLNWLVYENNTSLVDAKSTATVNDGNWHHVAVTVDASGNKLFIDGVQAGVTYAKGNASTTTFYSSVTGVDIMRIGIDQNNGGLRDAFAGLIDDVRVYDRALTAADVAQLATTAPTIAGLAGDSQTYAPGSGAVIVEQGSDAVITDIDSSDFNAGTLTVSFAAGSDSTEDVLAIRNQGSGAGQIGVSGANVTYAGTTIGTWTGGSGGSNLVITLNANANPTNTAALLQNITFQDTDAASPTGGARTIRFVLSDGDGGTSANYDASVNVLSPSLVLDLNSTPANLVTGGTFGTAASATPPANWVEGAATTAGAVVLSGANGRWDWTTAPGATATLTQAITLPGGSALRAISFDLAWQNQDASRANVLSVAYNGVTYATFTTLQAGTANAAGLTGTWTYSNGASGPASTNSVTDEVTGALTSVNIALPGGITASGNLVFTYTAGTGAGTNHDDIAIDNVQLLAADGNYDWSATYTENGSAVAIADTDSAVFGGTSVNLASASITLTNAQSGDRLLVNGSAAASGTLASGIAWTRTDSVVTLSGSYTKTQYADAIELVQFENTGNAPATTQRTINVVVSNGTDISNTAVTTITVSAVNDAPVLDNTKSPALTAQNEDCGAPVGAVGTLVSSLVDFASPAGQVDNVTDVDSGAVLGIAVTAADLTNGTWYYSTDGGTNWSALGTPSATSSRLLAADANTRLYFQPNANYNGTLASGITFRAWDMTSGSNGALADTSSNGGSTAFSTATDTASLTINAVNDAPAFGTGIVTTAIGSGDDLGYASALQADGKIVVVGYSFNGTDNDFAVVRYNTDGSLDTTFSGDGKLTTAIGSGDDRASSVVVQSDGKIVVAGYSYNGTNNDFAVVRYNADGSLDTTFSGDGKLTTAIGTGDDVANNLALQTDGKIVVVGNSNNGTDNDFAVVRYNTDGSLDTTFSGDGKLTTAIGVDDLANDVIVQPDGKIVVGGRSRSSTYDFTLVRYNTDGSLDTTFSGDGIVMTPIGTNLDVGNSLALQADGKILLGGYYYNGSGDSFAVIRYNTDGSLDTTFSGDGIATTAFTTNYNEAFGMAVQTDGTIVIAGEFGKTGAGVTTSDFAVVRFKTDGSLDTTFSDDGMVTTAIGSGDDTGRSVLVQADGKIVVTGYSYNGTNYDFAAVRYNTDGSLDRSFNNLNGTPTYIENGAAVVFDSDVQVYDLELSGAGNYAGATLTLARHNGANAQDVYGNSGTLGALTQGGNLVLAGTTIGTVTTNSGGTLVLTFNSNATQARVNSTLQLLTYANTSDAPPASVQIDWTFNDGNSGAQGSGGALSGTGSITVSITPVNDAPVGTNKTVTTLEDTDYVFTVADFGFTDPTDSPVNALANVKITTLPGAGTLTLSGVAVTAGQFVSAANITAGNLKFTPAANGNGASYASFTFQVQDDGGTANGGVDLDASPNTITVNVTAVNDAPSASNLSAAETYLEDTPLNLTDIVISEVDSANVTATLTLSNVAAGSLNTATSGAVTSTYNAGSGVWSASGALADVNTLLAGLTFTPSLNFNGNFTIATSVSDGVAAPVTGSKAITGTLVNDAPVGANKTVTMLEDSTYTFAAVDFGFTDPSDSPANALNAVKVTTLPAAGSLTLSGVAVSAGDFVSLANISAGNLKFTPAAEANGAAYASFTFQVQDDGGTANGGVNLDATPRSMTVNVTAVNDAPVGTNKTVSTNEDTAYTFAAADFGLTDPNDSPANALNAVKITTLPAAGSLTLSGVAVNAGDFVSLANISAGNLKFTPAADANGAGYASFTFQVQDDGGTANGGVNLDQSARSMTVNVTAVNDAPVNTVPGAQNTTQNTAVIFSSGNGNLISVGDVDAGGASIEVVLSVANGTLTLNGIAGLSFLIGTGTGDATMTFRGSIADINAALDGLVFDPTLNYSGPDSLSIVTDDLGNAGGGGAQSTSDTVLINVDYLNSAPTLAGANDLSAISEDPSSNPGMLVSALIAGQVSDVDAGAVSGIAVIAVDDTNGTWEYSTNGGSSWTAFGAPSANSARLLAANGSNYVRFVPDADWHGALSNGLTFRAWDQTSGVSGGSADTTANGGITAFSAATASASIVVDSVNDAPVGANKTVTTLEDSIYTFLASDFGFSDPKDSPANTLNAVKITTLPGAGSLTLSGVAVNAGDLISLADIGAGNLEFTPVADANGAGYASFTFQVRDDGGTANGGVNLDQTARSMTVDVTAVNDAPVGTDKTVTTSEDTAYTFAAADFGFSDPNDSPANTLNAVKISTLPGAGSLTLSGVAVSAGDFISLADISAGNLKFTPAADANGAGYASFTFQVQDDAGTLDGGVDTDVSARTITVNVTPVADVVNDILVTNEDSAQTINVLANDNFDASAVVSAVTQGAHGTVSFLANGDVTYTPNADYFGADSFTYTVTSGGVTETATVNVTVNAVVDVVNDSVTTAEGTPVSFNVLANDLFSGAVSLTSVVGATNGSISFLANGDITYTPNADFNGAETLTYTVTEDDGTTETASITLTVTPVTDAVNDILVTNEDSAQTINVLANDSFDPGAVVSAVTQGANGTVAFLANGDVTYTPNADYFGADSFTYSVTSGAVTETATVNVTVNPVADVVNDTLVTNEDSAQTINVLANDSFDPGAVVSAVTQGANGTVAFLANGDVTYTPNADYFGADSFTYTVTSGGVTETATVNVTVNAVVDVVDDSVTTAEDTPVTVNVLANDSFDPGAVVSAVTQGANGTVAFLANGDVTYAPNADYFGADSFTYSVTSGGVTETATVNVTVNAVADVVDDSVTTAEDTPVSFNVLANDLFSGAVSLTSVVGATNGAVSFNAAGNVTYTPNADFNGAETLTYTVTVDDGTTETASVNLTINPINDAPVMGANVLTIDQGASVVLAAGNISASDIDTPAGALRFSVSNVVNGQFELTSAPSVAVTTFTQAEVLAGQVRFVHNGNPASPGYDVQVDDGALIVGPFSASVSFNTAPAPPGPPVTLPPVTIPPVTIPPAPVAPAPAAAGGPGAGPVAAGIAPGGAPANFNDLSEINVRLAKVEARVARARLTPPPEVKLNDYTPAQSIRADVQMFNLLPAQLTYTPSTPVDWQVAAAFGQGAEEQLRDELQVMIDSVKFGGMALSVGVVWWASRISAMLGSLVASTPAWRHIDPLPVVGSDDEDDDKWLDPNDREADANELAVSLVLDGGRRVTREAD